MENVKASDQESTEEQKQAQREGTTKKQSESEQNSVDIDEAHVVDVVAKLMTDINKDAATLDLSLPKLNRKPSIVIATDAVNVSHEEISSFEDIPNMTLVENISTELCNDSGVEVNGGSTSGTLLRALSGSYGTGSCGDTPATASCDSSLLSCCSNYEDTEGVATAMLFVPVSAAEQQGGGASEGGSESSSVDTNIRNKDRGSRRLSSQGSILNSSGKVAVKKKSSEAPPKAKVTSRNSTSMSVTSCSTVRSKTTSGTISRHSRTNCTQPGSAQPKPLAASPSSSHQQKSVPSCSSIRSTRSGMKSTLSSFSSSSTPRSLLVGGSKKQTKDNPSSSVSSQDSTASTAVRVKAISSRSSVGCSRSKSLAVADDGCGPSLASGLPHHPQAANKMGKKQIMSSLLSMSLNGSLMESKATALEKYATLPRRRRHRSPEMTPVVPSVPVLRRSHSVSRDPSLNRAASLRKQHHYQTLSNKSMPPYPRRKCTPICHEMAVQTLLTADDMARIMADVAIVEPLKYAYVQEKEVQENQRIEVNHLEFQLKLLAKDHTRLKAETVQQSQEINSKKQQLKEERAARIQATEELERHTRCILNMLTNANGDHIDQTGMNCLQTLENYFQSTSHVVLKQQQEIGELQMLCRTLQKDLEKSLAAQKALLQQQQDNEVESMELQDFLQAEKSTLSEALRDAEAEVKAQEELLSQKDIELEKQQEECKHLVRISEQRRHKKRAVKIMIGAKTRETCVPSLKRPSILHRQENLALQARLNSLEQQSRELLLQQGAAVSGAAVALSGLSSRLDGLVEQLVVSYNISEKDLEVVATLLIPSKSTGDNNGDDHVDGDSTGQKLAVSRKMHPSCFRKILATFTNSLL